MGGPGSGRHAGIGASGEIKAIKDKKDSYKNFDDFNPNVLSISDGVMSYTGKDIDQKLNKDYKISDDESQSIFLYTAGSGAINDSLRGKEYKGTNNLSEEKIKEVDTNLQTAMDNNLLNTDLIVYRGFKDTNNIFDFNKDLIGMEFEDKGYVSTSSEKITAMNFSHTDETDLKYAVRMKIRMSKGLKALSVRSHSRFPDENEILINKGSKFRVVKQDRNNRVLTVDVYQ
jgi:hypothetical protein